MVTGGTRGIGAAISKALKAAGYKVAAAMRAMTTAAEKFKADTGIPVYKWDVASFERLCGRGQAGRGRSRPVDVLVNNAGITKDTFSQDDARQWTAVIKYHLARCSI